MERAQEKAGWAILPQALSSSSLLPSGNQTRLEGKALLRGHEWRTSPMSDGGLLRGMTGLFRGSR